MQQAEWKVARAHGGYPCSFQIRAMSAETSVGNRWQEALVSALEPGRGNSRSRKQICGFPASASAAECRGASRPEGEEGVGVGVEVLNWVGDKID